MATKQGIAAMFETLESLGLRNAPEFTSKKVRNTAMRVFHSLLPDIDDEQLQVALSRYLRSAEGEFWPKHPGKLLRYVGATPVQQMLPGDDSELLQLLGELDATEMATLPGTDRCACCCQKPCLEKCPRTWVKLQLQEAS